jgi:hypothetical protein
VAGLLIELVEILVVALVVGRIASWRNAIAGAGAGELGSLHLLGHEPPYGKEIGPLMRVFRQFQAEVRLGSFLAFGTKSFLRP